VSVDDVPGIDCDVHAVLREQIHLQQLWIESKESLKKKKN
jgi:hypothetical protein